MREFTPTAKELKESYEYDLTGYRTPASKKAFLTRSLKQAEEHHDDLVRAYKTKHQMLFGERVNLIDIKCAVREINLIRNLYKNL